MDSDKLITVPEEIIDRALDLLRYRARMNDTAVLKAIDVSFSRAHLSKSKTLQWKKNRYIQRPSADYIGLNKRQELAEAICKVLLDLCQIKFEEGRFIHLNTGETWYKLEADPMPEPKTRRAATVQSPVFTTKGYSEIYEEIKTASRVRILHTYIEATEIFCDNCKIAIEKNKKCVVEVMLLEPYSETLRLRMKGLTSQRSSREIEEKAKENYRRLTELAQQYPDNFFFVNYDEIPGFVFYQVDHKIYVGFQWYQKLGYNGQFYVADYDHNNPFHLSLDQHFNTLWTAYEPNQRGTYREFVGYFIRSGELTNVTLAINMDNYSAHMTNTKSHVDYSGFLTDNYDGFSSIFLFTRYAKLNDPQIMKNDNKRSAAIMFNFNPQLPSNPDNIHVGLYLIDTLYHEIKANVMVLIDATVNPGLTEEQTALIYKYLNKNHAENDTSEIRLDNIHNWSSLDS